MKLRTVHQVLIVAAAFLAAGFAIRSLSFYARGGEPLLLVLGVVSGGAAVGASLYLRRFRRTLSARLPR